jgi:hypothetical protein
MEMLAEGRDSATYATLAFESEADGQSGWGSASRFRRWVLVAAAILCLLALFIREQESGGGRIRWTQEFPVPQWVPANLRG